MFDAAHSTASTSPASRPARASASFAAATPISARIDSSSLLRSAIRGAMWVGSRSEEHTSELQSLMRISYAVFCLKKKNKLNNSSKYKKHLRITTNKQKTDITKERTKVVVISTYVNRNHTI